MVNIFSIFIALLIAINPLKVNAADFILAGGCFWCLEHDLEKLEGVNFVKSGYSGGDLQNPTYENHIGHQEVVLVDYTPDSIGLDEILRVYLRNIDPLDGGGQFCDRGDSYRPVIFFNNPKEEKLVEDSLKLASQELKVLRKDINVELKQRNKFWIAEDYHQDYAEKNPLTYNFYRFTCGRDKRLEQLWEGNASSNNPWRK